MWVYNWTMMKYLLFYRQKPASETRNTSLSGLEMAIREANKTMIKTRNPSFMVIIQKRNIKKSYAVKLYTLLCVVKSVHYSKITFVLVFQLFCDSTFLPVLALSIWVGRMKSLQFREVRRGKNGKSAAKVRRRSEWEEDGVCFAGKASWELEMWLCLSLSRGVRTGWWSSLCFLQLQFETKWLKFVVLAVNTLKCMVWFWKLTLGVFWVFCFWKYVSKPS